LELAVGQKASYSRTITEYDVLRFADITGDLNPLHVDESYARHSRFGTRIAHGALTFGLISAAIGTRLPGAGTIYRTLSLEFIKPVYFDDTITATVEIAAIFEDKGVVTLKTQCTNQRGEIVARGEAVVLHADARRKENTS